MSEKKSKSKSKSAPAIVPDVMKNPNLSVKVHGPERLEALAAQFGFMRKRGRGVGAVGSINALMQAIADGDIVLRRAVEG